MCFVGISDFIRQRPDLIVWNEKHLHPRSCQTLSPDMLSSFWMDQWTHWKQCKGTLFTEKCLDVFSMPHSPTVFSKNKSSLSQANVGPGLQLHGPARSTDLFALRQQTATLLLQDDTHDIPWPTVARSPSYWMILDASPPEQTSFLVVWRCLETSLRKRCCCCCVCLSPFLPFTVSFSLVLVHVLVMVLVLSPSATVIPNHTNYGWIWLDCGPLDHVRSLETALAQDHPKSVPWRRSLGEDHHTDAPTHGWPETYRPPSCAAVARSGCNATSCTRTALDMMMWANALSTITNYLKGYSKSIKIIPRGLPDRTHLEIVCDWVTACYDMSCFGHISESCLQCWVIPLSMADQHQQHGLTCSNNIPKFPKCSMVFLVFNAFLARRFKGWDRSQIPGTSCCQ